MKSYLWLAARLFAGFIFAFAGYSKLLEPIANFEATLMKYGVYPPAWVPAMARVIPWLEWLLGTLLFLGYAPRLASAGTALLSLGFIITLGSSPLFLEAGGTDCGCFGQSGIHLSLRQIFVVDLFVFLASLRLVFLKEFPFSLDWILLKANRRQDDKKTGPKGGNR
jgi:uncharacterized membrane protein YphA (DoxX/SURF4 family)